MQFFTFWGKALWASLSFGWVVFGVVSTAMPALFAIVVRYWPYAGNVHWVKWSSDHQSELHVVIAAIFIAIYLVYAPYKLFSREHTARLAAEQAVKATPQPAPIRLDVADLDTRKKLDQTQKKLDETTRKLDAANETIHSLSPLEQPIASVRISVSVSIPADKSSASEYIGQGAMVWISKGRDGLLVAKAGDHFSDGKGKISFNAECDPDPPDESYMGKPIKSLTDAEYIQVAFLKSYVPINSIVTGGRITFVVNNQVTLSFVVPAQTLTMEHQFGEMTTLMFIRDLTDGMKPLRQRPSEPIPDKEASTPEPAS